MDEYVVCKEWTSVILEVASFTCYEDAVSFCESRNWVVEDENGKTWYLVILQM